MAFHSKMHNHILTQKEKKTFCCNNDENNIHVDSTFYECKKCNFCICKKCFEKNRKKTRYKFIYSGKRRNFKKSLIELNISNPTSLCYKSKKKYSIFSFCTDSHLTVYTKKILKKKLNLSIKRKHSVFSGKRTSINGSAIMKTRPKRTSSMLPKGFYSEDTEHNEINIII